MTLSIDKPVIVLGAGGHAKVLIAALRRLNADIIGATDVDARRKGTTVMDVPVIGDDSVVSTHPPARVLLVNGLGTVKSTDARRRLFDRFSAHGYRFATLVDPLAFIAGPVEIGEGSQVLAGAVLQPDVQLGANVIVNTRASIDHDCWIGAHVHIAPGVILSGGVHVSDGAHIGTGASVIHNVRIGAGSVIGAGAVVIDNVAVGVTVVGVPARIVKVEE